MKSTALLLLIYAGVLMSCGRSTESDEDKQLLAEASTYHQQATAIQGEVEPQIDQIDSLKTILNSRSTPATKATITTLDSLKTAFEEWEENLVEVPGMEHHEHHDHGKHEHHHHADPLMKDLPPAQMRDLQRELLNAIKQIQQRTNETMQQLH
jgi:hypothetical protein